MAILSYKAKAILSDPSTRKMVMEYYDLTDKDFPPFNYDDWHTIDEWYFKLTSELERLRKEKQAKLEAKALRRTKSSPPQRPWGK